MQFVAVFLVLQTAYGAAAGTWLERLVVDRCTVIPAAALLNWLTPDVGVTAAGSHLRAPGGGINVLNGCEGIDIVFMLIAAFSVAPLGWRSRLLGLSLGALWVLALNQVRIVVLFYSVRADKALFAVLHGVVAPLILVGTTCIFFALWLNRSRGPVIAASG